METKPRKVDATSATSFLLSRKCRKQLRECLVSASTRERSQFLMTPLQQNHDISRSERIVFKTWLNLPATLRLLAASDGVAFLDVLLSKDFDASYQQDCNDILEKCVVEINNKSNRLLLSNHAGCKEFASHAVSKFLDKGFRVVLSTDNDGIFDIAEEHRGITLFCCC